MTTPGDAVEPPSVPLRCGRCGYNTWHVFEHGVDRDGHVVARLRCATPRCPAWTGRHWLTRPAAIAAP